MERSLWKEEYRLGIKKLDDDHIAICDLLEHLLTAINEKRGESAISAIFGNLNGKLNEHFRDEERYLLEAGYPKKDIKEHMDGHLDVHYTVNHEYSNWENSSEGSDRLRELSNVCRWVWIELVTADMQVKKKLKDRKEHM